MTNEKLLFNAKCKLVNSPLGDCPGAAAHRADVAL